MFQKIQKKIREFIKEKGQGTVEYALIIGFVAIIAVYMLTGSGLQTSTKKNITNISDVLYELRVQYAIYGGGGIISAGPTDNPPPSANDEGGNSSEEETDDWGD